jgi:hypothetical protein
MLNCKCQLSRDVYPISVPYFCTYFDKVKFTLFRAASSRIKHVEGGWVAGLGIRFLPSLFIIHKHTTDGRKAYPFHVPQAIVNLPKKPFLSPDIFRFQSLFGDLSLVLKVACLLCRIHVVRSSDEWKPFVTIVLRRTKKSIPTSGGVSVLQLNCKSASFWGKSA